MIPHQKRNKVQTKCETSSGTHMIRYFVCGVVSTRAAKCGKTSQRCTPQVIPSILATTSFRNRFQSLCRCFLVVMLKRVSILCCAGGKWPMNEKQNNDDNE